MFPKIGFLAYKHQVFACRSIILALKVLWEMKIWYSNNTTCGNCVWPTTFVKTQSCGRHYPDTTSTRDKQWPILVTTINMCYLLTNNSPEIHLPVLSNLYCRYPSFSALIPLLPSLSLLYGPYPFSLLLLFLLYHSHLSFTVPTPRLALLSLLYCP